MLIVSVVSAGAVGAGVGAGLGVAVGVGTGVGIGVGVALGGVAVGDGVAVAATVGVGSGVAVGAGVGSGLEHATTNAADANAIAAVKRKAGLMEVTGNMRFWIRTTLRRRLNPTRVCRPQSAIRGLPIWQSSAQPRASYPPVQSWLKSRLQARCGASP